MTKNLLGLLAVGAALIFAAPVSAHADTYKFDPAHTNVTWNANHFGFSNPHGIFSLIEGTLDFDQAAPEKSRVDVTINTGNLFTGNEKFDNHLKSKDFFNIAEFPTAKFVSYKVEKTGDKTGKVYGKLTLLGVTKDLTLDVTFNKSGENILSKAPTVGFSATAVIKRSQWGMVFGTPGVSDDVNVTIEAEANK